MTFLAWLALITLIVWLLIAREIMAGNRSVRPLREISPDLSLGLPRVSVIVAARNEARNILEALDSLLGLAYPEYELIVVDDRSDDGTGGILDGMAASEPRLKVIHVDQLPSEWLGKNHALWLGANRATGELLLFTDADIVMEPTSLTRAVRMPGEPGCPARPRARSWHP